MNCYYECKILHITTDPVGLTFISLTLICFSKNSTSGSRVSSVLETPTAECEEDKHVLLAHIVKTHFNELDNYQVRRWIWLMLGIFLLEKQVNNQFMTEKRVSN